MLILIFDFHFSYSHLPVGYHKNSNLYLCLSGSVIYIFCMRKIRNDGFLHKKKLFCKELLFHGFFMVCVAFFKTLQTYITPMHPICTLKK